MATFDLPQLTAVATFAVSLCAVLLVLATIATARADVLGSRLGWTLVAAGVALLATRVLGHFAETDAAVQTARHVLGIVGGPMLAIGLYLVLRPRSGGRRHGVRSA